MSDVRTKRNVDFCIFGCTIVHHYTSSLVGSADVYEALLVANYLLHIHNQKPITTGYRHKVMSYASEEGLFDSDISAHIGY